MNAQRRCLLSLCALVLASGCITVPQAPLPTGAAGTVAQPNLMQFLGLAPVCTHLQVKAKCLLALLGKNHPCLEPKPPLLPLSDPANLQSPIPAVAAAAKIKAAEDAAPQKIKALQYLATIGCTACYPGKDGPLVQEAFLAALHDCTEEVRFAAVKALLKTGGDPCAACKAGACCSPEILRALHDIAFKVDPFSGCYVEPSARVRRVARLAIRGCGNTLPPPMAPSIPLEGPIPPPGPPLPPPPAPGGMPVSETDSAERGASVAANAGQPPSSVSLAMKTLTDTRTETDNLPPVPVAENKRNSASSGTDVGPRKGTSALTETEKAEDSTFQQASLSMDANVTERQIQDYYESHPEQFRCPAEVRWERMTANFTDFETEDVARATMEFARQRASGLEADPPPDVDLAPIRSRIFGWTARQDVSSPTVAHLLFSLPVGRTSVVIRDESACHLVRVLEQRGEHAAPLSAVREEVVRRILEERRLESQSVQHLEEPPPGENPEDDTTSAETARVTSMQGMSLLEAEQQDAGKAATTAESENHVIQP